MNHPAPDALEPLRTDAADFLAAHAGAVVRLTERLIAAPSPNLPGDETAPAALIQAALAEYELPEARVLATAPNRPNLLVRIDGGRPGRHLALCGHLDTKPVGEAVAEWRTDPFRPTIVEGNLYGLGATDMKGACAAMVLAGAAFAHVADRAAGSLTLLFTADEEYGSRLGAEFLAQSGAIEADAILLGEPAGITRDWEAVRIVSRGFSGFRVVVGGTQTHSSISDQVPSVNAVEAMAAVITGLRRELHPSHPAHPLCPSGPSVNIGVRAEGGVGYGVLPGHAEVWTDIRTTPGMTREQLALDIDAALERIRPNVSDAAVSWEFAPALAWIEPTEIAADHPLVRATVSASTRVLGTEPPLAAFSGATDAWAFQALGGVPTLAAWGPGLLPLAHGPNEYVSIAALEQACAIFALTALEFGAG
jgi:acetylornithine deacetylase/succinyl-diaminopimelate desuccinylase-like protein